MRSGASADLVLALARGGVPVGFEIARALRIPLDVFVVRKLGVPGHEELAMGAVAAGVRYLNEDIVHAYAVSESEIDEVAAREQRELAHREHLYRDGAPPVAAGEKKVILTDDGLATGASMISAIRALRILRPANIIIAVPVGAPETCAAIRAEADEVLCLRQPDPFTAVGLWYAEFDPTTDAEVQHLLREANNAAS